ncbi:hypothetical protein Pfo_018022 [Paulownia fortunei]|nr:hypothetical protein Pfo_018022 [Paulownia fortunei]
MNLRSSTKLPSKPPSSTSQQPHRLFTQKDEIDLLQSLSNSIGIGIPEGHFSEAQITDKIRRLKQRYHKQARSKSSIKTAHDRKTYEIARKIWGPKQTRISSPTPLDDEKKEDSKGRSGSTIKWSGFPFLMRQVSRDFPRSGEVYKQGLRGLGEDILKGLDEKWMELEMEEAAIEARRAQLVYNQLKSIVKADNRNL